MNPLTNRQAEVLAFVREHIDEKGFAPTTEELAAACGLGSPSGAHRMLRVLEEKGYVRRTPGRSRAVVVLDGVTSLEGATGAERYVASVVAELQGAARDSVLAMAARVADLDIKTVLISDAAERQDLVRGLSQALHHDPPVDRRAAGALTAMLGALRVDADWPTFVVDHLVFNRGSALGARRFGGLHPALEGVLRRIDALAGRAEQQALEWLLALWPEIDEAGRAELRARAATMVQVSALTARLIEQQAGEEGAFREGGEIESLPAPLG